MGIRPDGRSCGRLLGVSNADHSSLFIKRKESNVYLFDLGGSGIIIECPGCSHANTLFSDSISEEDVKSLVESDFKRNF